MESNTKNILQSLIPENLAGIRLDKAASMLFPNYSRMQHKNWIVSGNVKINGIVELNPRKSATEGRELSIEVVPAKTREYIPQPLSLTIVHEDPDFFIVDKPAGMVVHPGAGNPQDTLLNALLYKDQKLASLPRAGLIHRLDKDTTGLLLVARSEVAYHNLLRQMQARQIKREYETIVQGNIISGGTIDLPLGRHPRNRTQRAVVSGGKRAVTHYRVITRFLRHTHLSISLETGRTHQIRVHLSHIGHGVIGDQIYTKRLISLLGLSPEVKEKVRRFPRQALHANCLSFMHPVKEIPVTFQSPLPQDIHSLLVLLGQ